MFSLWETGNKKTPNTVCWWVKRLRKQAKKIKDCQGVGAMGGGGL